MSRLNANSSSITDIVGCRPAVMLDGGTPRVWKFPELGVEAFKTGEMVCLSGAAGSAVGLTRPGTDASGYGIVGFAANDAAGTASSLAGVWIATPDVIFVGNVTHPTSATAQTAATDVGQLYGLTSLSGKTSVDKSKTNASTSMVRVVGLHGGDTHPCFYGKVYFKVISRHCQLDNNININLSGSSSALVL